MSALENAQQLKEEMIQYRDELIRKIGELPPLRTKLYQKLMDSIKEVMPSIEWKIINVAGQYMILPFTSVDIPNYPQIKYNGTLRHLKPPISAIEIDVIMPDPLQLNLDALMKIKDIDSEVVTSTLLYRVVPPDEGGDVCNTKACYLFPSILKESEDVEITDPRVECTGDWGCQATVLYVGRNGYAIYRMSRWINKRRKMLYISETKRFGARVYAGNAYFELMYKSPSDLVCKESFMAMTTLILPLYCNPDTEACVYPPCEYSDTCPDGYRNDVEFMGVVMPIDTCVVITKLGNTQIIPFAVLYGGKYPTEEDIVRVYAEAGVRFLPAEIYTLIKPVTREYPTYSITPAPME